jgi:hypothetical protein
VQPRFGVGSKVYSSQYGAGEVITSEGVGDAEKVTVRFDRAGERQILTAFSVLEPLVNQQIPESHGPSTGETVGRAVPLAPPVSIDAIKEAVKEALREGSVIGEVKLLDRWRGGRLILKPGREGQKEKEIPLDDFFHKIVMLRDRLRVLEQKLNSHSGLSDADKVELQQYVTRIYGTLTTFNVLFADRDDWFVGQKGE